MPEPAYESHGDVDSAIEAGERALMRAVLEGASREQMTQTRAELASVCPRPYSEDDSVNPKVSECLHIAELFEQHDRKLIVEQHAVHHDEEQLVQSARDTARELESLLNQDLNK